MAYRLRCVTSAHRRINVHQRASDQGHHEGAHRSKVVARASSVVAHNSAHDGHMRELRLRTVRGIRDSQAAARNTNCVHWYISSVARRRQPVVF